MKRHCFSYSIGEVAPYIDWSYLLHAWGIGCNDVQATEEIIRDAKEILRVLDGKYCTQGIFALCDAQSKDDDIIIEGNTLPLLRQQHSNAGKHNLCLSDFISPKNDSIGLFATSIDAMAIGVSFAFTNFEPDWFVYISFILIGVITITLSSIGVKIGNIFGTKYKSKAEFAGGLILILLGLKILLEGLGILK